MLRSRTRRWTTAPVLAIALLAAACGDDGDRPAADDWEPVWVRTEALVPDLDELVAGGRDLCGQALGEVRASRQELLPAPTSALDDLVESWLAHAETMLFECPHDPSTLADLELDLDRQAGLVSANLQTTWQ
jgi:hypothetical protein